MLIEQFDTGLKSKKDIKDINLSYDENRIVEKAMPIYEELYEYSI